MAKQIDKEMMERITDMAQMNCPLCNNVTTIKPYCNYCSQLMFNDRELFDWVKNIEQEKEELRKQKMEQRTENEIEAEIPPNGNYVFSEAELSYMQKKVTDKYREILEILHFDLTNHNIAETPERVAKMYVRELFKGCYTQEPKITSFPNKKNMSQMVLVGPIDVKSSCSHHLVNFLGSAYIGYVPNQKLVGLSKFARVVDWFSRRPQIQEELNEQIANYLEHKLEPKGIGVYITAKHLCMTVRGVEQTNSYADTCSLRGIFMEPSVKNEFMNWISLKKG